MSTCDPKDLTIGSIAMENDEFKVMTNSGLMPINNAITSSTIISGIGPSNGTVSVRTSFDVDDFLDEHIMNRVTVDHKVQEHELMKLKEVAPDYANEIKENLAKNISRDIIKKVTFTKKHDKDADVHHFIGRVWMFTEDELKNLLLEARNA